MLPVIWITWKYITSINSITWKGENTLFNMFNPFYLRYVVKDHLVRGKTCFYHFFGYSFPVSIKGSFICTHREDSTYHGLGNTNCGALAGTRNNSMGPPRGIDLTTHLTMTGCSTRKHSHSLAVPQWLDSKTSVYNYILHNRKYSHSLTVPQWLDSKTSVYNYILHNRKHSFQ